MSFQRYSDYRDVGSDLFGELPIHWEHILLKRVVLSIKDGTHGTYARVAEGKPLLSAKNVFQDGIRVSDVESLISEEDYAEIVSNGFPAKGDILVTCVGTIGRAFVYNLDYAIAFQRSVAFLRLTERAVPSFYKWYIESAPYQDQLKSVVKSSAQGGVYMGDLVATEAVLPPAIEQVQIANFLGHETTRIDALVEEQQRLIELLKEKRQAVISNAVTKGLDSDVPMKDSGVEWLGEVPAHWRVGPIRWYATIQGGIAKGKSYDAETLTVELPYLRVANVQDGYVDLSTVKTVKVAVSEVDRYRLQEGDVLMNEGGDNDKLGRGTVWEGEVTDCLHQNHVFAIRPNQYLLPHWLSMFTRSNSARAYFYLYSKQSTNLASISSSSVMSCQLPLPPVEEQRELLEFLTIKTARLDDLMHEGIKTIELLQERRSALISAAVTGKIDVRGWQHQGKDNVLINRTHV